MRNFFVCSSGEPGKDYVEKNFERCISKPGFVLHENTNHPGAFQAIKPQDIILLKYNGRLVAYGIVEKNYISDDKEWNHWADVAEWYFSDQNKPQHGVSKYGIQENTIQGDQYATVKQVKPDFAISKMRKINNKSHLFVSILKELKQTAMENQMEDYYNLAIKNHNLILNGAPGTGKTYLAKKIADRITTKSATEKMDDLINMFTPSPSARKERENIRQSFLSQFPPEKISNMKLEEYVLGLVNDKTLCWWVENGLTKFGIYSPGPRGAQVYGVFYSKDDQEYKIHKTYANKNANEVFSYIKNDISKAIQDKESLKEVAKNSKVDDGFLLRLMVIYHPNKFFPVYSKGHTDRILDIFNIKYTKNTSFLEKNQKLVEFYRKKIGDKDITLVEFMNIIYKNFDVKQKEEQVQEDKNKSQVSFVQFHPSYDYTDFVEGLRPIKKDGENELGFELRNGVFKELCIKAKNNPENNYVLIIDEINRAEISRVFGELFFAIEPGYRGEEGSIQTQYANMQTNNTRFDEDGSFYVPKNVYIIGTMNDIDRSVEAFDFAMRRRFTWVEVNAKDRSEMLNETLDEKLVIKAIRRMNNLNEAIEKSEGLNSSYHIGPAYFLKLQEHDGDFEKLWKYNLKPLILEYLRGLPNANELEKQFYAAYKNEATVITEG